MVAGIHIVELDDAHGNHSNKTNEEHQATKQAKKVHWLDTKLRLEPQCHQVEITIHKTVKTKLRLAILAGLVVHHLLAYLVETGIFGQIWDVAMHVAINLDVFHHITTISL